MKGTCEQIPFHFFLKFMMLGLSGDVCDGDGGVCVGGTASVQKDQEDSHGCGTEKCGVREL